MPLQMNGLTLLPDNLSTVELLATSFMRTCFGWKYRKNTDLYSGDGDGDGDICLKPQHSPYLTKASLLIFIPCGCSNALRC